MTKPNGSIQKHVTCECSRIVSQVSLHIKSYTLITLCQVYVTRAGSNSLLIQWHADWSRDAESVEMIEWPSS